MFLEIITPDKKIYSGKIKLIKVPGSKGSFEILKNHAPIISTLEKGEIKVIDLSNKESFYNIDGGMLDASNNNIIVLAEKS